MTKDHDFIVLLDRLGPPPRILWGTCGNTSDARARSSRRCGPKRESCWRGATPWSRSARATGLLGEALALYRELVGRGLPASRPFVGNGMWVTSLRDPDGYEVQFESLTDAPEDTQFAS